MAYIILAAVTIVVLMIRRASRQRLADLTVPGICKIASLLVLHGGVILILGWSDDLTPGAPPTPYWLVGLGVILFGSGFYAALIPRRRR